jgi:hypothetical protein
MISFICRCADMSIPQALQQINRHLTSLTKDVTNLKADAECVKPAPRGVEDAGITRSEIMTIINTASKVNNATMKTDILTSAKAETVATARTLIRSECPAIAKSAAETVTSAMFVELSSMRRDLEDQQRRIVELMVQVAALQRMSGESSSSPPQGQAAPKTRAAPKRKPKAESDALVI